MPYFFSASVSTLMISCSLSPHQMSGSASSARNKRNKAKTKPVEEEKKDYERRRAGKQESLGRMWRKIHDLQEQERELEKNLQDAKNIVYRVKRSISPMTNPIFPLALLTRQAVCPPWSRTAHFSSSTGCSAHTVPPDVAPPLQVFDVG